MNKRPLGTSGIEVSPITVGCWSFGGGDYWGEQSDRDAGAVISAALDIGINSFDTAEIYNDGRSEEALGRILRGRRDQAVIGAKIPPEHTAPDVLRERCEASLRRLQTDYIDIYMVHWPLPSEKVGPAFETLEALKQEGKIRAIGVSNFGVEQLGEALEACSSIAVNQLCYNLLSRAIEVEIAPMCQESGVGVAAYMPLLQGILTDKYDSLDDVPDIRLRTRQFRGDRALSRHGEPGAEPEVESALNAIKDAAKELGVPTSELALAWAMAKPGIATVVGGARNEQQLIENARAADIELSPDAIALLDAATQPVLDKIGSSADYFDGGANGRVR